MTASNPHTTEGKGWLTTLSGQQNHYAEVRARLGLSASAPVSPAPAVALLPMVFACATYRGTQRAPLDLQAPPSGEFFITLAALRHGVKKRDILGDSRSKHIVAARYDAMAMAYQHTQRSLPAVGRLFGRDHTTIIHALRKMGRVGKLVDKYAPPEEPTAASRPERTAHDTKSGRFVPGTALQRAVKRAYENEVMPSTLADEYGCSPLSVKVLAHRLGLKRSDYRQKAKLGAAAP